MIVLIAFIIIIDQLTKHLAIKYLKGQSPVVLIKNFLSLHYTENAGAAFGILQEKRMLFVIITTIFLLVISFYIIKYFNELSLISKIGASVLLGGAIGNYIDRVRHGFVVDFISAKITKTYDFPVFNIADMAIVLGTLVIVYVVLFDKHSA
ncbi:signal peptidase II [Paratissierella segnis]|uniref:Lipoprotein signal peptidase n=1 Tax=Paratissierella segnis TaxID=2763679 RepID=A0A926EUB8_9FIRM|nr:signal peptidase II [Paratissierella segnis]MBC8588650.1 signal peptidase II [Paratissierella segnis]